jgi:hypothetical protein
MLKDKAKEHREVNKDKINAKNSEGNTCECGCTSKRDKISQHKKSSRHQKLMEEKNKIKRNLTDEDKAVRGGVGKQWRTCATRDCDPRLVWTSLPITH